jgi:amino acid transporter
MNLSTWGSSIFVFAMVFLWIFFLMNHFGLQSWQWLYQQMAL